jgi:hypothetical protein
MQCKIDELELDLSKYLDDLEAALFLMTKLGNLFDEFEEKQKNQPASNHSETDYNKSSW